MKKHTMSLLNSVLSDRWLVGLLIANFVIMIIMIIVLAVIIDPKETQVITQYSAFGVAAFYRGYWYSLWMYAVFELILVVGNAVFSAKLVQLEKRDLALALAWLTIGLSVLTFLFARSIIKIAALG